MTTRLESMPDHNTNFKIYIFLFIPLLVLVTLLVFDIKIGLIILLAGALFTTVLVKPIIIYFLLISLFSIEGFGMISGVSAVKLLGVFFLAGLTLNLALTKEALPKDSSYKFFYLFFAGSIVSFAFAKDLSISLRVYLVYGSLLFLYIVTRYFLRNIRDINTVLGYLFISTVIAIVIVKIFGLSVRSGYSSRISSGIGDPNAYASFILVLIPLVLYRIMHISGIAKNLYWGCLVIFLMLLVLTASRGGMLGFLGAAGVIAYYYSIGKMRQVLFLSICVLAIAYFAVPDDYWSRASSILHPETEQGSSISVRIENYKAALKMFMNYPVAGVGLYNFSLNSGDYGASTRQVVHNSYLEVLSGGGLLSFIPFSLVLIDCWRKLKLRRQYEGPVRDLFICLKASFVSILITSSFLSADHEKILWFLLALISSAHYIGSKQFERSRRLANNE